MTFDGKRFNFMGTCSYYLIKNPNFDIIVDNIKCGHGVASCTKSVTIDINGITIKLDHNHQLFVNNKQITRLPYEANGIKIKMVSSLFMQVNMSERCFYLDQPLSYFSFQPMLHDWCNKGCVILSVGWCI